METRLKQKDRCERRCLVQKVCLPKHKMVRFVVDPQGVLVPDIYQKLPGRGLWVEANRAVIEKAIAQRLFARSAKRALDVPDGLLSLVERQLVAYCQSLLSLSRRAGQVTLGFDEVHRLVIKQESRSYCVFLALDAPAKAWKQLVKGLPEEGLPEKAIGLTGDEMGRIFNRMRLTYVALNKSGLANQLRNQVLRLRGVRQKQNETKGSVGNE